MRGWSGRGAVGAALVVVVGCGDAGERAAVDAVDTVEVGQDGVDGVDGIDGVDGVDVAPGDAGDDVMDVDTVDAAEIEAPARYEIALPPLAEARLWTPSEVASPLRVQPALAFGDDGRLAVAWTGKDGDGLGIVLTLERLDAQAGAAVAPFIANTAVTGLRNEPALCALAGGGYVLAWSVDLQNGADNLQMAYRRFDRDLAPLDAEDVVVTTDRAGNHWLAEVACDAAGGFALAGVRNGAPEAGFEAFVQRVGPDGVARPAAAVLARGVGSQFVPQVAVGRDGELVVAWEDVAAANAPTTLMWRRIAASGEAGEAASWLTPTSGDASAPALAADPGTGDALLIGLADTRQTILRARGEVLEPLTWTGSTGLRTTAAAVATGGGAFGLVTFEGTGDAVKVRYARVGDEGLEPSVELARGRFQPAYRPAIAARAGAVVVAWTESLGGGSYAVRLGGFREGEIAP